MEFDFQQKSTKQNLKNKRIEVIKDIEKQYSKDVVKHFKISQNQQKNEKELTEIINEYNSTCNELEKLKKMKEEILEKERQNKETLEREKLEHEHREEEKRRKNEKFELFMRDKGQEALEVIKKEAIDKTKNDQYLINVKKQTKDHQLKLAKNTVNNYKKQQEKVLKESQFNIGDYGPSETLDYKINQIYHPMSNKVDYSTTKFHNIMVIKHIINNNNDESQINQFGKNNIIGDENILIQKENNNHISAEVKENFNKNGYNTTLNIKDFGDKVLNEILRVNNHSNTKSKSLNKLNKPSKSKEKLEEKNALTYNDLKKLKAKANLEKFKEEQRQFHSKIALKNQITNVANNNNNKIVSKSNYNNNKINTNEAKKNYKNDNENENKSKNPNQVEAKKEVHNKFIPENQLEHLKNQNEDENNYNNKEKFDVFNPNIINNYCSSGILSSNFNKSENKFNNIAMTGKIDGFKNTNNFNNNNDSNFNDNENNVFQENLMQNYYEIKCNQINKYNNNNELLINENFENTNNNLNNLGKYIGNNSETAQANLNLMSFAKNTNNTENSIAKNPDRCYGIKQESILETTLKKKPDPIIRVNEKPIDNCNLNSRQVNELSDDKTQIFNKKDNDVNFNSNNGHYYNDMKKIQEDNKSLNYLNELYEDLQNEINSQEITVNKISNSKKAENNDIMEEGIKLFFII